MTHPNYTRDLLENFSRTQLHEVCDAIMIARRRSKEDCIVGILAAQPQRVIDPLFAKAQELGLPPIFQVVADRHYLLSDHQRAFVIRNDYDHWDLDGDAENPWVLEEIIDRSSIVDSSNKISRHSSEIEALESLAAYLKPVDEQAISRDDHANDQAELEAPVEQQNDDYLFHDEQPANLPTVGDTHFIGGFLLRCAQVNSEYAVVWDVLDEKNVVMGEARMGWDCFWTHTMSLDTFATPQEAVADLRQSLFALVKEDEAIAFEKVADGRWDAIVNGVLVRITLEASEYKCNLADTVFTDYESAVKGSLVAVARVQEKRLLERTERANTINVLEQNGNEFVVNNCENGNHYIVRPNHPELNQRCECADCHYRGAKCKHQIAVEKFLSSSLESAVALSFDDLLDKPFDELTLGDWEILCEPELELVAA